MSVITKSYGTGFMLKKFGFWEKLKNSKQANILLVAGIIFELGLLSLISAGNLTEQAGFYVGVVSGLFLIFGLTIWLIFNSTNKAKEQSDPTLLIIMFFAVLFRFSLVFAAPTLSTDQFRYIWEGRLITQGISPYQYAPTDPALTSYRSEIWPLVQQRETTSPYPPVAQAIAAVQYWLFGESLVGPKIIAVFFDLLNCLLLLWLLKLYKLDLRRIVLYAWCPLPILEFGLSGHNDAPMLSMLLLAIGLSVRRKPGLSAVVLGLAVLAKFIAIFGLPLFLVVWWQSGLKANSDKWGWRSALQSWRRLWIYPALTVGVIVVGYLPLVIMGKGAIGSLFEYTGSWRDNDSLIFQLVADYLGLGVAKIGSLLILGVGGWLLTFHPRFAVELSLPRRLMLLFGLILLVASTVHVWYLSWLLVLLPLAYWQGFKHWDRAWLLFAALVQLTYLTYNGNYTLYNWIKPLEYWPLYSIIGWAAFKEWRSRSARRTIQLETLEGNIKNDSAA